MKKIVLPKILLTTLCCLASTEINAQIKPKIVEKSAIPVIYSPNFKISLMGLEKLHPFDIAKYDKIFQALKKDDLVNDKSVITPKPVTEEQLLLIHSKEYLITLKKPKKVAQYLEAPVIGRVLSAPLLKSKVVDRFKLASGGTIEAGRQALEHGYAILLGGGYHHAKPNIGEGFCIIADVPIAIKQLQKDKKIKRALIIDTDAHQGNGTIVCLKNDPTTFTYSIHQQGIYPIPKERGDLDVSIQGGTTDKMFLKILKRDLPKIFKQSKPDIVFHVAGCDTLAKDPLANIKMTHDGIAKRDLMIAKECHKHQVPYVMTMAGGYSKGAWKAQYLGAKGVIEWASKNPINKKP